MPPPRSWTDRGANDLRRDEGGSAPLEFIVVGLLLLVPLVYLIASLGVIQSHALGVESGARHLARAIAMAPDAPSADARAAAILQSTAEEYGISPNGIDVQFMCVPAGGACPARCDDGRLRGGVGTIAAGPAGVRPRSHCQRSGVGHRRAQGVAVLGRRMIRGLRRCAFAREREPDDEGSVMLLTLGYAVLAIAVILVGANAASLYLAQKQLDSVADAAALAGADGFALVLRDGEPRAVLTNDGVRAQASALVDIAGSGASLVSAITPDGVSARVTVAATWHPILFSVFVPSGVGLDATATSRTAVD